MQPRLTNARSESALKQLGARIILGKLVNVPAPEDIKSPDTVRQELVETGTVVVSAFSKSKARAFVARFGPLRPWVDEVAKGPAGFNATTDVILWANLLRTAWTVPRTKAVIEEVNSLLNSIFQSKKPAPNAFYGEPEQPEHRPLLEADFGSGKLKPIPRTLLDVLAIELLQAHSMLDRCHNPRCSRLFVKAYSRDRYCTADCGNLMRGESQRRWAEEHREELNRRRRKANRSSYSKTRSKTMSVRKRGGTS